MVKFEIRYGQVPAISESIIERTMKDFKEFASLFEYDPLEARKEVYDHVDWLKENKDFLGRFVELIVDAPLERFSEALTHKQWMELRCLLLRGVLLLLQTINQALTEQNTQTK